MHRGRRRRGRRVEDERLLFGHALRIVPRVCSHVPCDHVAATRGVRTLWALVWFLAGVRALVRRQMVGAREHLAAHLARVRLHAGVQSHVPRQHVGSGETAVAYLAGVRLGDVRVGVATLVARRHVLGEAIVQRKHLTAHRTHVGHVRTGRHLLDDRRHIQIVAPRHRFFGCWRRHVALDHGHADRRAVVLVAVVVVVGVVVVVIVLIAAGVLRFAVRTAAVHLLLLLLQMVLVLLLQMMMGQHRLEACRHARERQLVLHRQIERLVLGRCRRACRVRVVHVVAQSKDLGQILGLQVVLEQRRWHRKVPIDGTAFVRAGHL